MPGGAFDVAVVGAGPAGSATACALAHRGARVVLLERSRFETDRIGESLAPNIQAPLRALGLWPQFLALAPLPSWGTCSRWGGADIQRHSHLFNPYGQGWHIDRRAFDRMLADGAASAGVDLVTGVAIRHCRWRDGVWDLRAEPSDRSASSGACTIAARILVDATGRNAGIGCRLGATRLRFDRLVGIAMRWEESGAAERHHLLVEAVADGWWYSAPLPGSTTSGPRAMVAMLMTDADLCARLRTADPAQWLAALDRSDATRGRLAGARSVAAPRAHCAHSQRLRRAATEVRGRWLAVGDAALAVDPISGSGVLRALSTAHEAAEAVVAMLRRPDARDPVIAWECARDEDCARYLDERAYYYAAEQRFSTPFWRRRHLGLRPLPPTIAGDIDPRHAFPM